MNKVSITLRDKRIKPSMTMRAQNVRFNQVVGILKKLESKKPDSVRVTVRNRATNRSRSVTTYDDIFDGTFNKLLKLLDDLRRKYPALVLVLPRYWINRLKSEKINKKIKRMIEKGQLIAE